MRVGEYAIGHVEERLREIAVAVVDSILRRAIETRKRIVHAHLGRFAVKFSGKIWEAFQRPFEKCGTKCQYASTRLRFLRHRFSPKSITSQQQSSYQKETTLPMRRCPRWQSKRRHRSGRIGKPKDTPTTKPWPGASRLGSLVLGGIRSSLCPRVSAVGILSACTISIDFPHPLRTGLASLTHPAPHQHLSFVSRIARAFTIQTNWLNA